MRRIARVWRIAVVAGLCLGGTAAHAQTTAGGAQIVSERPRFLVRHLENLLRPWRKRDVIRDCSTRRLHNLSDFVSQLKKREIQST